MQSETCIFRNQLSLGNISHTSHLGPLMMHISCCFASNVSVYADNNANKYGFILYL